MNYQPIHISKMSGKMLGIPAISTSCLSNTNCQKNRQIKGSICSKCFAVNTQKCYKSLPIALERNNELFSSDVIPWDYLPVFNYSYVRLESFGDLINSTHLLNYVRLAEKNPNVTFALWTKRHNLSEQFFSRYPKPKNLIVVYSSIIINQPVSNGKYSDKTFTVYSKDYIKDNNVKINCGAKSCLNCKLCYTHNSTNEIKELLK